MVERTPNGVGPDTVQRLRSVLLNRDDPIAKRMRAIFTLRNINTDDCVDALKDALTDPSALLAHEVAYCIGQMRNARAIPHLETALRNESLCSMVRHEAAEALGAIGDKAAVPILREFSSHSLPEIAETCQVALDLIEFQTTNQEGTSEQSDVYHSVDPAPPAPVKSIAELKTRLNDASLPIFQRYRALFKLRNIGTPEAVEAICSAFGDASSLFRHELAYVLGQIQSPVAIPTLRRVLEDKAQHEMVRHEAAEALGAICDGDTLPTLETFVKDDVQVVRQSCEVALDIHDYFASDQFQYADGLVEPASQN